MILKHSEKTELEMLNKWLSFLEYINDNRENRELIGQYFFNKFAKCPEVFYEFILHFKKTIVSPIPSNLRVKLANSYLGIISAICERFGLYAEKEFLDDFCFKIVNPKDYARIDKFLSNYKKQSQKFLKSISTTLNKLLKNAGFGFEIKGRYKSLYSVFRKLLKNPNVDILSLRDIFAFRIILKNNSTKHCFDVLDLLHDHFYPLAEHFKDYITIPKINGYQGLHVSLMEVIPHLTMPIEVQIRTQAMDDLAEKGMAAHWIYAKKKKAQMISDKERKLIDHFSNMAKDDTDKMVYFFSYEGNVFKMEKGSTIIDFAYNIHSNLGDKLKQAIVNNQEKDIYYKVQEGDRIQLIKSDQDAVREEWLDHTNNKNTRKKIYEKIQRHNGL